LHNIKSSVSVNAGVSSKNLGSTGSCGFLRLYPGFWYWGYLVFSELLAAALRYRLGTPENIVNTVGITRWRWSLELPGSYR